MERPRDKQSNYIAEFVLNSVPRYEELNADSPKLASQKFNKILTHAISKSTFKNKLGETGAYHMTHGIDTSSDIVVKRLYAQLEGNCQEEERDWREIQSDHELVEHYFGRRFVPPTTFLTLEDESEGLHLVIQEKCYPLPDRLSPQLKNEAIGFVQKYEKMMREGAILDGTNDLMTDKTSQKLQIIDTNGLIYEKNLLDNNTEVFLQKFGVDIDDASTPDDMLHVLTHKIPEFEYLQGKDYQAIVEAIQTNPDKKLRTIHEKIIGKDRILWQGFDNVRDYIDQFAPKGSHNFFIQKLLKKFKITESELIIPS